MLEVIRRNLLEFMVVSFLAHVTNEGRDETSIFRSMKITKDESQEDMFTEQNQFAIQIFIQNVKRYHGKDFPTIGKKYKVIIEEVKD